MRAFFSHTLAVLLVLAAAWLAPDAAYAQSAGASLLLDGTDDYMTVTSNTTLDVTTAYTLEAWVYPTGTFDPNNEATRAHILSRWGIGGAGNAAYMLGLLGNGKVRAANHDGTTTAGVNSTVALTTGQWNHIASTFANGTLAIYINGVQQGQATGIVPPQVSTHYDFNIGRESNGGKYFQGRVDEARIWNAALTQAEIQANQNRRLSGGERAGALVGYWPFDAGTTTTVDLAGNDNTGTLTNGASIDAAVASAFTAGPPSTVAGNALTLNGTDEYVALGSFSLPESFTFEMWVNPTSTDDGQAFFGKHATSGTNQFLAGYYNGAFTVNIRGDEHVAGTKITGWHHLAVVVNKTSATASDVTVYRNGTELWQTPLADVLGAADGLPWLVGMD
ncbi:MAG: LamG domain-containing protein, partial [Bacteroidota bacterium]